jgi:hypothetical protein
VLKLDSGDSCVATPGIERMQGTREACEEVTGDAC